MRLLLTPSADKPWSKLKSAALAWLIAHPAAALQVYHAAHQAHGWPPLDGLAWRESQLGPPHATIFNAEVSLAHEDWQPPRNRCRARHGAVPGSAPY